MYRYKLTSTGHSSARYGPCEICDTHVSEVFIQTEQRQFSVPGVVENGWTGYQCFTHFGHESCLKSKQRNQEPTQ